MATTSLITPSEAEIQSLLAYMDAHLGTETHRWFTPDGYNSVALAIIDSIYSTGNRYSGVENLLRNYKTRRLDEGGDPSGDNAKDLLEAFNRWGGVEGFVETVGYRWRLYGSKLAPYKAQGVYEAAVILEDEGLGHIESVRQNLKSRSARETSSAAKRWKRIQSQRSGLTWNYFLMLAGIPGIKADRMITRFVSDAMGRAVSEGESSLLLEIASDKRGWGYTMVDHTIWRYQSGREHVRSDS